MQILIYSEITYQVYDQQISLQNNFALEQPEQKLASDSATPYHLNSSL